jgi:ABC-type oligopeptide transport system substrate-binding subunit
MWRAGWESPEINRLTEEAKRENSAEKRRDLYHILQRKLLDSPIINMFQYDRVFLVRDNISGIELVNGSNKIFYEHVQKA